MKGSKIFALVLSAVCAAPVLAAQRVTRVAPSAGSGSVAGLDPEVAAFQQKMTEITKRIDTIEKNIQAIKIPNNRLGAIAAQVALGVEKAALAEARAEAKVAGDRMKAYLARVPGGARTYGKTDAQANFESKQDAANLKPKDDRIMRGAAKGPASAGNGFSATEGFGGQKIASKPTLQKVGSHFGYTASGGGSIGAGFSTGPMEPSSAQQTMQINAGGATGQSAGGVGMGAGGAGIGATGTTGPDSRPSVNPTTGLSENKSDVEQKAYERQQKMLDDKAQREEERRKADQQAEQQRQQMMAQMAQQAAQAAAQAAQKAAEDQGQGQGQGGGGGQQAVDQQLAALNERFDTQLQSVTDQLAASETARLAAIQERDAARAEADRLRAAGDTSGAAVEDGNAAAAEGE